MSEIAKQDRDIPSGTKLIPASRESTTYPPLGPGYYSTRVSVERQLRETPFSVGYFLLPVERKPKEGRT